MPLVAFEAEDRTHVTNQVFYEQLIANVPHFDETPVIPAEHFVSVQIHA